MNFTFTTAADKNGHKTGLIREGAINELGQVSYTKDERFDDEHYPSFEEIVANEVLKRIYGVTAIPSKEQLKDDALKSSRKEYGIECPSVKESRPTEPKKEEVKIGVNVHALNDDEFIEFTKRRVQSNKEFERFKAIKAKIRSTLEGKTYNEKAFDLFVRLHEIEKRGFFNKTKEDDEIITEAIKLYGAM